MGGNAFTTPAQRLTTSAMQALFTYSQLHLVQLFPQGVDMLRNSLHKTTHGDLDLFVACDWAGVGMKGLESGVIQSTSVDDGLVQEFSEGLKLEEVEVEDEAKKIKLYCEAIARALGATKWVRSGHEVSNAVPCHLVPGTGSELAANNEVYYQVDVILMPSSQIRFSLFTSSYGSTVVLLATALRVISRSLTLHMSHLVLRHSPFFGLPGIEIFLTSDPIHFCTWTGLNLAKWEEETMETELDVWKWVTDVDEKSLFGRAWRRLARPRETSQLTSKGKPGAVVPFIEWLRSESRWFDPNAESAQPISGVEIDETLNRPMLDPLNPIPLDHRAIAALIYWHKDEEYNQRVEERRVKAEEISSNQQRRLRNREKHQTQLANSRKKVKGLVEKLPAD